MIEARAHCRAPLPSMVARVRRLRRWWWRWKRGRIAMRPYVLAAFGLGGKGGGDGYRMHQHGCRTPKHAVCPCAAVRPYTAVCSYPRCGGLTMGWSFVVSDRVA
ncbi:hypothetical protein HRbin30_00594 [bacterium HR30]|nr:hypothetical protein HRbin30_00594 [bacterium HR30]